MEETTELAYTPKIYMVDTNVFRYRVYEIGNLSVKSEQDKQQHKLNARAFFDKATSEAANKEAIIMVSGETKQELTVQAHTLKTESKRYNKILKTCSIENTEVPQKLEFMLRDFSNYIRGNYSGLVETGRKTDYLQTSDARILVHAYLNDAVLVTANIKDFFFYPLFFDPSEDDVLYDITSKQHMKLLPSARIQLTEDVNFKELVAEMQKLKG